MLQQVVRTVRCKQEEISVFHPQINEIIVPSFGDNLRRGVTKIGIEPLTQIARKMGLNLELQQLVTPQRMTNQFDEKSNCTRLQF